MNPDTEPATAQKEPSINNLKMETIFRSKNIHQYAEIVYWMIRALKEQGDIKDSTLSAINLHLHAIKTNISELESEIYYFINSNKNKGVNNE